MSGRLWSRDWPSYLTGLELRAFLREGERGNEMFVHLFMLLYVVPATELALGIYKHSPQGIYKHRLERGKYKTGTLLNKELQHFGEGLVG